MPTVLLINPNTSAETTDMMLRLLRQGLPDRIDLVGATAARGALMLTTEADLTVSLQEVLAIARAHAGDVSAIVVGAFGDPGVATLRASLGVPIIGIGEAAMREAASGGRAFGVATTTPGLDGSIAKAVERHGLQAGFTGVRIPSGGLDPLELSTQPERQYAGLAEAVQRCIDDGATAVVIGGGPLAESAEPLAKRFDMPVISPIAAAGREVLRSV